MTLTPVIAVVQQNVLFRLYKYYIIDSALILKGCGFKELVQQRGWKFLVGIFAYYLVRDTILYLAIPLCVARGLLWIWRGSRGHRTRRGWFERSRKGNSVAGSARQVEPTS